MSYIELLAGALLGAATGEGLRPVMRRVDATLTSRRRAARQRILADLRVRDEVIKYYDRRGYLSEMFVGLVGQYQHYLPIFSPSYWRRPVTLDMELDFPLKYSSIDVGYRGNLKLIRQRQRLGYNIFNDPTLYLEGISSDPVLEIKAGRCEYFATASSLIALENETHRLARTRGRSPTPIRDHAFCDVETVSRVVGRPYSVGCTVVLALRQSDHYEIPLHTRSAGVITAGSQRSLIPNFGFEPHTRVGVTSAYGRVTYNFIKEYAEELFNYEELIRSSVTTHLSPDWFMSLPEPSWALDLLRRELLQMEFLGLGIDLVNGTAIVAILAKVNDEASAARMQASVETNWEVVAPSAGNGRLTFLPLGDGGFELAARAGDLSVASAFALSLAEAHLAHETT